MKMKITFDYLQPERKSKYKENSQENHADIVGKYFTILSNMSYNVKLQQPVVKDLKTMSKPHK